MAYTCQFVDSIAASPNVRLDLNDGVTWKLQVEGTEFPPPPLRRAVAQTLLMDGGIVPSSAYDNRVLRMRLALLGSTAETGATQTQMLARELNRPANIVRWQPATTAPVFFRTFRSDVSSIQEIHGRDGKRFFQVEILAEPFAYGLLETIATPTIANNPAAGTNPQQYDVTGIKGDVDTPLYVEVDASTFAAQTALLAVRRHGTPSDGTWFTQCETFTQNTDTTTQVNDATASGTGNNYSRTTFATATAMTRRMNLTIPITPTLAQKKAWAGEYRVFVRVRKSVGADPVNLQLKYGGIFGDAAATLNSTSWHLVNLGLMPAPAGSGPRTAFNGVAVGAEAYNIELQAQRVSGTTNLDWDYVRFVPADEELLIIDWGGIAGTGRAVIDGPLDDIYQMHGSDLSRGSVANADPAESVGAIPMLTPNQTSRLFWLSNVNGSDAVTSSLAPVLSYFPRYLSIRPAAT